MNKSELLELIKEPDRLKGVKIDALKRILSDFPFYQGAQALLTKALANEKHYEFDQQLRKAALSVPDRDVLYRYIHNTRDLPSKAISLPPEIAIPPAPDPVQEVIAEEPVLETVLPEAFAVPPAEEALPPVSDAPEVFAAEPEAGQQPEVKDHEDLPPATSEHSFAEWLRLTQKGPLADTTSSPDTAEIPENDTSTIVEQPALVKPDPAPEPAVPVSTKSNIGDFESILDKFIKESPSISRPKAEFFNPANMARQSVEEDEYLVTETLANVYYKQGHYKKAIRAYEKLCLIYPHKMAYFADLIQKIKQENKD